MRLVISGSILVIMFLLQPIIWLNIAQIQQMKGNDNQMTFFFTKALVASLSNAHLHWQAGAAMARLEKYDTALSLFSPMTKEQLSHPLVIEIYLKTLLKTGKTTEALRFYQGSDEEAIFSSRMAATLVVLYVSHDKRLLLKKPSFLLAQALTPDSFEHYDGVSTWKNIRFETIQKLTQNLSHFQTKYSDPNFWVEGEGRQIQTTLEWYGKCPTKKSRTEPTELSTPKLETILEPSSVSSIHFGPELAIDHQINTLPNEETKKKSWQLLIVSWYGYSQNTWDHIAFVMGYDCLTDLSLDPVLRIDGLRIDQKQEPLHVRADFQHPEIPVKNEAIFISRFLYRTENVSDNSVGFQFLSPYTIHLPSTAGVWKRATIIERQNFDKSTSVTPFLFLSDEGSVWFDELSIQELYSNIPLPIQDVILRVEDVQ